MLSDLLANVMDKDLILTLVAGGFAVISAVIGAGLNAHITKYGWRWPLRKRVVYVGTGVDVQLNDNHSDFHPAEHSYKFKRFEILSRGERIEVSVQFQSFDLESSEIQFGSGKLWGTGTLHDDSYIIHFRGQYDDGGIPGIWGGVFIGREFSGAPLMGYWLSRHEYQKSIENEVERSTRALYSIGRVSLVKR